MKLKLEKAGMITSTNHKAEITNISLHGIWLFHNQKEYFLPYSDFPWFKEAKVQHILNLEIPSENHFYWPDLDIDLNLDSITNPEDYPLISK